ncbi:MAG: sugar phosphate nucleotidyltransferase [Promethearchaeota archaeon]
MTKAIILSGGWGTRLRPLTCTIPKTMIPVVNRPVIERQMILLKKAGIQEIILAVSVMADALKKYFKNGASLGLKILYTEEKRPMGTAGAIKLAEELLEGENFFMLNGDIILNFDFKEMLKNHEKYGGIGTIASKLVDDPSRYGVLIINEETMQIEKFLEKDEYSPPEGKQISMPINAGVYMLEPEVFKYIPPKKKVSIEREVFPKLAGEKRLYHHPITGIWKDIGKPTELLDGNFLLLQDLLKNHNVKRDNIIDNSLKVEGKIIIYPPCAIGENVIIQKNCRIGPNVIIGDNVYIDSGTEIKETLIYNETYISKNVKIERSIISNDCHVRDGAILKGNEMGLVILASNVEIKENLRLINKSNECLTVCHHEVIKEDIEYY